MRLRPQELGPGWSSSPRRRVDAGVVPKVVLTGQMQRGRAEITAQANAAGLRMMTSVSRKTTVAAADPDSLSGKAEDARALGIPVVNEHTFMRVLHAMS